MPPADRPHRSTRMTHRGPDALAKSSCARSPTAAANRSSVTVPLPLFGSLLQADPATPTALDAIQHLIDTRPLRQPAQLPSEVLL